MRLPNNPIIEARGLSWSATSQDKAEPQPLLVELNFAIAAGERVLVTGPSGSGKSTVLRAIANVLQQTEPGVFGGELYVRGRCGLLLQDPANSFVAAQLGGEVAFGPENLGLDESEIRSRVQSTLKQVALPYGVHRSTVELSGGESQRMQLAAVLAMQPDILLLDEPLSMLDPLAAASVRSAINDVLQAKPETTAIVVDHDASSWAEVVSRVLMLSSDGRLLRDEPIREFLRSSKVKNQQSATFDLAYRVPNAQGSITAFVGASGAGKTTELHRQLSEHNVAEVGWVPQQPELTVAGNTVWQSATATVKNLGLDTALALRLLNEFGLQEKLEQNPHRLSGGEMRRLALVSALAHHPRFLILDEPTVGQDAETWQAVAGVILAARNSGLTVLVATHDQRLVALADSVVVIEPQVVVATPKPRTGRIAALPALLISFGLLAASVAITSLRDGLIALGAVALVGLASWPLLPPQRIKRFVPIVVALASIWISNSLFAAGGITPAGFERANVVALRVAFFALPSVVLAGALQPAELAASLVRWFKLPARPAVAAAAALVRLELIGWQWAAVQQTRRLRGFKQGRAPLARSREFAASLFALLVQSLRSAGDLAVAMQARAFGEPTAKHRTWVRF